MIDHDKAQSVFDAQASAADRSADIEDARRLVANMEEVHHPEHYGGDVTYEAIKVIEAWDLDFCLGNAAKYICRAGKKNQSTKGTIRDLQKAIWYVERRIIQLRLEYMREET